MRLSERNVVSSVSRLTLRELRLWVREGWVRPAQSDDGPVFDELDVARIRLLCDLRKEMAIPTSALPPVLTLIDQLHRTRRDLRRMTEALDQQAPEIRRAVIASIARNNEGED